MYFNHIGYLVKNLEDSIRAFEKLGYAIEKKTKYDDIRKADIVFVNKDFNCVELISPRGKESPIYGLMKHYKNSPYHLCFSCEDILSEVNRLQDAGYFVFKDIETAPCMDNGKVVFLMHPDIGMIELYEK